MNTDQDKKEQITLLLNKKESDFVSLKKTKEKRKQSQNGWYYLGLAGDIGFTIAIPMVLGALIGKYFKETLAGLAVGMAISFIGFIGTIRELIRKK